MLGVRCVDVVLLESIFKLGWCFPLLKLVTEERKALWYIFFV